MVFSAFVIYYSFSLGIGSKAKLSLLAYCLVIGIIMVVSLFLLRTCQWDWSIGLPQF